MRVVALGTFASDLEVGCFGTLCKYAKSGNEVHLIVDGHRSEWTGRKVQAMRNSAKAINAADLIFMHQIDHSGVTQDNVSLLRLLMKRIKPSIAFIPSEKTNDQRMLLARSAIVACRDISNILMYEVEHSRDFSPEVYHIINEEILTKKSCLELYGNKGKSLQKKLSINKLRARQVAIKGFVEAFECNTMLLDRGFL